MMRSLILVLVIVAIATTGFGQYIPKPIDSTVINTPGELDRVLRLALNRVNSSIWSASVWVPIGGTGADSVNVVIDPPFSDANYQVSVCLASTILYETNFYAAWSVTQKTSSSFRLIVVGMLTVVGDSTKFDLIAVK